MRGTGRLVASILFIGVLVAASAAAFAIGRGTFGLRPLLGLDLVGGISVVLQAPAGTDPDVMERALDRIRSRVDAVGVAEPDISLSGNNIQVQLPGLGGQGSVVQRGDEFCAIGANDKELGCYDDRSAAEARAKEQSVQRILELIGTTARLEEREVLEVVSPGTEPYRTANFTRGVIPENDPLRRTQTVTIGGAPEGGSFTLTYDGETTSNIAHDADGETVQARLEALGNLDEGDVAVEGPGGGPYTVTFAEGTAAETMTASDTLTGGTDPAVTVTAFTEADPQNGGMVTYEDVDEDGRFTINVDPKYRLGPIAISGEDLQSAAAQYVGAGSGQQVTNPGWRVLFTLTSEGRRKFADITTKLTSPPNTPGSKQLAIILDKVVQSAPTVNEPITGGQGEITGDFTEQQAKDLAVVLNSGALPTELERQEIVTVSPTLGRESLRQGLIAGLVGLAALMLYLAFYYRLLGIVTWFGMAVWAALSIGLISLLGKTVGYAMTLAGVAGLVVSLGVTADSYIVFYERLKDEVRHGKSLRSAVQPAFKRSWKTIVAADIVTILGAVVLYVLAVGSVRGFALTLGLATALDMVVVYFFKRPLVFLLARNAKLTNMRGFGLRSGVVVEPAPVAGAER